MIGPENVNFAIESRLRARNVNGRCFSFQNSGRQVTLCRLGFQSHRTDRLEIYPRPSLQGGRT